MLKGFEPFVFKHIFIEARDYMEIGLREWLIVIGIIVIAGILFDGWRRMRGGKGKLKFRLDRSYSTCRTRRAALKCSVRRGCWIPRRNQNWTKATCLRSAPRRVNANVSRSRPRPANVANVPPKPPCRRRETSTWPPNRASRTCSPMQMTISPTTATAAAVSRPPVLPPLPPRTCRRSRKCW